MAENYTDIQELPKLTHFKLRRIAQGISRVVREAPEIAVALQDAQENGSSDSAVFAVPALIEYGSEELERIVALAVSDNKQVGAAARRGEVERFINDKARDIVQELTPGEFEELAIRVWNEVLKDEVGKLQLVAAARNLIERGRKNNE